MIRFSYISALIILATSCTQHPDVPTGDWRVVLRTQGQELPFNLTLEKSGTNLKGYLRNGEEHIELNEIYWKDDSLEIVLHTFDAILKAHVSDQHLEGYFIKRNETNYRIPFTANLGETFRFTDNTSNRPDYSGKYQVYIISDKQDTTVAVGLFEQHDGKLSGTFLTPSSDYRYLAGEVDAPGRMNLSTFDGNHSFLFRAEASGDTLYGDYYSGKTLHKTWTAIRDEHAQLPDPESRTYLREGYESLDFAFPDPQGNTIRSDDPRFKGKVVILQILGSWCPNCLDETKFLMPWYEQNKARGVEILGLAFEQKPDFDYASKRVNNMIKRLGMTYPVVIAGTEKDASSSLPALNRVMAFPTTIFIGRDGKVKRIHTGFDGPATGAYFEAFEEHFNELVNELLAEEIPSSSNPSPGR